MDKKIYLKTVLEWREKLYTYYIGYEKYVKILVKFIMALVAFYMVSNQLPYQNKLEKPWILLGLSLIGTILPYSILVLLVTLTVVFQIYFLSPVLAAMTAVFAFVLYLMVARYDQKSIVAVVFLPIFIIWKIPFAIALVLGLLFGPTSILTAACGVVMYYILQAVKNIQIGQESNVTDILSLVQLFLDRIIKNQNMYVMLAAIVAVVFVTWFIRTRKMSYAFEIAILAGTVCGILMLLFGNLVYESEFSIMWVFLGSLLSGVIGYIVHFMHMVLDYGQTEDVQFEDDDYYYYVRAVPKMKMTIENKKIKKIYSNKGNTQSRRTYERNMSNRNRP
ncbi:MAG: hypothetical protein HFJ09_13110 [Lachnospiraceae bacterium]|nr:hypothetical protein [Lachnospiraceae bacterium]